MADILLKPREQRLIKINVPFIDEISELAMIKLLDLQTGCANTIKVKFIRNNGFRDVTRKIRKGSWIWFTCIQRHSA